MINTVSEFSKSEIVKYFNVEPDRIRVISNGWQHYNRIAYDENALSRYGLTRGNYYFSICSLEPNKNFKWIAEEARMNPNETFAVAGSINKEVFAEGLGFDCPENMHLLGYVSDEEAKTLMRDCKAFLFPTFYEGFGLPPLEAMSAGARSIYVSDTKVMHEVFADSVQYIDPNRHDIALKNPIEIPRGEIDKTLARYSWQKSAVKLKEELLTQLKR